MKQITLSSFPARPDMTPRNIFPLSGLLLSLLIWLPCQAQPMSLEGKWYRMSADRASDGYNEAGLTPIDQVEQTGGHFSFRADFEIEREEVQIVDFKNSSVIGNFHHRVFDSQGRLVAEAEGGIQNATPNPFFLRHGREFRLTPGHYRLFTEVSSPFLLAQPAPYLDTLDHYRQAVKSGNALTLLCLGLLLGLAFYYAALAAIRRNATDALYAMFILGNLLYNGAALLVYPDLFDLHWLYLISLPILLSNSAYVLFVIRLLDITPEFNPRLYRTGMGLLGLFAAFVVLGLLKLNWSLELDRLGVALFLSYGLVAGIVRAREGCASARMYLFAVITFSALGTLSITLTGLKGVNTLYIEHLGLIAVSVEALLLALVLARQFEQLREEKDRAVVDSFDKSRFLAAASHDLRQPMHALGLFVGELREQVTTPHQTKLVRLIEESASAMSGLLDSLLDVSKLDAGMVIPKIQAFPMAQLLNRMEQEYVPLAAKHGINLKIRFSFSRVESDAVLLERILSNLLSNAIRCTPEGGRVLLVCRRRGRRLRIEVRDNGIGIPLDKQQDIFREFVQLDNAERSRDKGLGLGLSIVQRICRLLHCPLSLRSAPGRGSVFSVELPLAQSLSRKNSHEAQGSAVEAVNTSSPSSEEKLPHTRVLVVEDDPLVMAGTQRLLSSWGYEVRAVPSLMLARQLFPEFELDLLICDYRLPDGNGMQVIRAAEQYYRRRVPCIMISGDTAPDVLKEVKTHGCHLLHKPVQPAKLRSLILFVQKENRVIGSELQ